MAGSILAKSLQQAQGLSGQMPSVPFRNPYLETNLQSYFPRQQPVQQSTGPSWNELDRLQYEREKERESYERRLSQQTDMLNQYESTLRNYKSSLAQQPYLQPTQTQGLSNVPSSTTQQIVPTQTQVVNTGDNQQLNFRRNYTFNPNHKVFGLPPETERMIEEEHAKIGGLPITLIKAIALRESGGRQNVTSSAGARGIMQIIPKYAHEFGGGDVINDPRANIRVGINEINSYYKRFGDIGLALLAYNWGPGNVQSYLKTGRGIKGQLMPKEAREYVDLVLNNIKG